MVVPTLARSGVYDFLSLAFLYPQISLQVNKFASPQVLPTDLAEAFAKLRSTLQVLSPAELEAQYVRVFGHTLSPECPPYETEYGGGSGEAAIFQRTQRLADIVGFYRAWGLEISEQAKERPDHIAIELEFMSYLAFKEAYAAGWDEEDRASLCRQAQQKFLKEHLGWWVLPFTRLLERCSSEAGADFYEKLARLTRAWLAHEFAALGVTPPTTEEASFHVEKEEHGCDTCPLAST